MNIHQRSSLDELHLTGEVPLIWGIFILSEVLQQVVSVK